MQSRTRTTMASRKRILSSPEKSPARQNLFGPVDREQLQQEYQDTLRRDLEDTCRRWGFDFLSDKPLAGGDFQWEEVLGTKVPLFYLPCLLGQGDAQKIGGLAASTGRVRAGPWHRGKENIPCTPEKYGANLQNLEKPQDKNENKLKRKQTNLTDFYQAKKRVVGTSLKSGR
ncbi:cyclin-dependent kinase inhibitor 1 isoform X1 [Salmo salar]|uniref:Cyclin-dependent kinase inhibitor 1 isoform X1 n=2 Tax=Salmo salar TaxID=8030 RepID=A0A1S3LBY7_SALSA|nr:cyclin-dependent kinase inhibitor 1 isoform X1 [Salmo salar]|eukprot:XP_013988473.1 PREDICTED: cyclin-dependent kinase inhibitor 1-like isoform X2 [Salmo salar]